MKLTENTENPRTHITTNRIQTTVALAVNKRINMLPLRGKGARVPLRVKLTGVAAVGVVIATKAVPVSARGTGSHVIIIIITTIVIAIIIKEMPGNQKKSCDTERLTGNAYRYVKYFKSA